MNRALFLIIVGLGGAAVLVSLGVWQVQRLAWKEGVIADIEARIVAEAVALPADPDPATDAYLPVTATGTLTGDTLRILVSQKHIGPGFRLITAFDLGSRVVLLDRGVLSTEFEAVDTPSEQITAIGNLQWPREVDGFTPEPDVANNIWFAREVSSMADRLGAEPVLIVARALSQDDPRVTPLPVDTSKIPNDHLQYAITWFSLAAIWLAMSLLFLRRRRATPTESET